MNIIQCTFCKKPFQSLGKRICNSCLERIDRDFITVRDYIYENKHASIDTVAEETEVPKQIILYLLKEGRLIIDDPGGGGVLFCESCKKPIQTGRMCDECKHKFANKMSDNVASNKAAPEQKKKEEPHLGSRGSAKI